MSENLERYVRALALFALGVVLLGHGTAATVFVTGMSPATVALPLVGSVVAYRSLVELLPSESSLAADGFLVLLASLTTGFVNLVVPAVYRSANAFPTEAAPPSYREWMVVGVAGFTALARSMRSRPSWGASSQRRCSNPPRVRASRPGSRRVRRRPENPSPTPG